MVKAKEIMVVKESLATCEENTPIEQVITILTTRNISSVLVQKDELVFSGIVTTYDILDAYGSGLPKDTEISRIMSRKILYADEEDDIETVSKKMVEAETHHLLIRNKLGVASGLISTYDITKSIAGNYISTYPFVESLYEFQEKKKDDLKNWISKKTSSITETISDVYGSALSNFEQ
eukprot:gene2042-1549_t